MPSPFIPQRVKRAKQQITAKIYQDQLAVLDSYGRFIDDSRDYIVSQALELVFKRDKEFVRWVEQQRNVNSSAERMVIRADSAGSAQQLGPQRREKEKRPRAEALAEIQRESAWQSGGSGFHGRNLRSKRLMPRHFVSREGGVNRLLV